MYKESAFYFSSSNAEHNIKAYIFVPESKQYKGVVQISHGMNEHIYRYEEFISFLCRNNYIVCGNDHAGHGESFNIIKGYFGNKDGDIVLIEDMRYVHLHVKKLFPDLPYFMLGHSMGSFLTRKYMEYYSNELDGVLLSGTGNADFPVNFIYGFGILYCKIMIRIKGSHALAMPISVLSLGGFRKHFKPVQTRADWQTRDLEKALSFVNDPKCQFTFTYAGYRDLLTLIKDVSKKGKIYENKSLPVFLFSGDDDPVGLFGRSVNKTYKNFINSGIKQVYMKLYNGGRHEMLNEINRNEVYNDLLEFLNNIIKAG